MTIAVKNDNKMPLVIPLSLRRKAGFKSGQDLKFSASNGVIIIAPKATSANDEYTPAERRAIDSGIAASEKQYAAGKSYGPFRTATEAIASLDANLRKRAAAKKRKLSGR